MVHKMQFSGGIRVGNRNSLLQEWQSAVSKRETSLNENLFTDRQYCRESAFPPTGKLNTPDLGLTEGHRNAMLR